jgi:hypothetical protein
MAFWNKPPADPDQLKALVLQQLEPVVDAGTEELWRGTHRLLDWLNGKAYVTYVRSCAGTTDWGKCDAVEFKEGLFMFSDTCVPLAFLFQCLREGRTIAEFQTKYPAVTKEHVSQVLDHLAWTIYS